MCQGQLAVVEDVDVVRVCEAHGVPPLVRLKDGPWGCVAALPCASLPDVAGDDNIAVVRKPFVAAAARPSPLGDALGSLGSLQVAVNIEVTRGTGRLLVDAYARDGDTYVLQRGNVDLLAFLQQACPAAAVAFVPDVPAAVAAAAAGKPPAAVRSAMPGGPSQSTGHVMMVAPTAFGFNADAAQDNEFMHETATNNVTERALSEFADLHRMLTEDAGVRVELFQHSLLHGTPDACFPNNWFSSHSAAETGGERSLVLFPMKCANRAAERRPDVLASLATLCPHDKVVDLTDEERHGHALEGTGALVLDRVNGIAYVSLSPRADRALAERFAASIGYNRVVSFVSRLVPGGQEIYHTNVMMAIGSSVAVLCADAIEDDEERAAVLASLRSTGHHVVAISRAQVDELCGNVLELRDARGVPFLAMSSRAHAAFGAAQRAELLRHVGALRHVALDTIEHVGGGGVRCTLAELF